MLPRFILFAVCATILGVVYECAGLPAKPQAFANQWRLEESTDNFGRSLHEALRHESGNLFYSPISVQAALAMAYAGADGNTAQQLRHSAFMPPTKEKASQSFGTTLGLLKKETPDVTLLMANGVFPDKQFPMKQDFVKLLVQGFKVEAREVDYKQNTKAAIKTINDWTIVNTKSKIKELVNDKLISSDTRLVLVNAIYFKGTWKHKFYPQFTEKDTFHLNSNETKQVDFMQKFLTLPVSYRNEWKAHVVEIPYEGDEVSMIAIVPDEIEGLKVIEPKLKDVTLKEIRPELPNLVQLKMPKFKMEKTIQLTNTLSKKMGMSDMFDPMKANFRGISNDNVSISDVIQKSFIEVNEEGSEAAAATGFAIAAPSSSSHFEPLPVIMNKPILFYIAHNPTSTILFTGRLSTPIID